MLVGLVAWVLFGFIAGFCVSLAMRSKGTDLLITLLVGTAGALIGGFTAVNFGFGEALGFNFASFIFAAVVSSSFLFLFYLYRRSSVADGADAPPKEGPGLSRPRSISHPSIPKNCIFISYRREDTAGFARAIYNELANRLKKTQLFMDVDTIEPGRDFVEAIEKAMSSCRVLLVLIGRNWNTERLGEPGDYIRVEIAQGLNQTTVRVVPVLVDGARMPRLDELPTELAPLIRRNAATLSHDRFQSDVETIARLIRADLRS